MFERFTERARHVVVLAQDEARGLQHNYIGTEHLLLGLLREEEGIAARVLRELGVTLDDVRSDVTSIVGVGDEPATHGQIAFTPRAKRTLDLSLRAANELGHGFIGTEHVLLGLAREGDGVGSRILSGRGASAERLATAVLQTLQGGRGPVDLELVRRFSQQHRAVTRGYAASSWRRAPRLRTPALPWLLGAATLGVGILIGWAIWGQ